MIQVIALGVMHFAVHGRWLHHFGALFLAMAFLYHGLTEVMQWIWPGRNDEYRSLIDQRLIDNWVLFVSVVMLIYAIGYAVARPKLAEVDHPTDPPEAYVEGLSIKWLALLTIPLLYFTLQGLGAIQTNVVGAENGRSNYTVGGLALQFLVFNMAVLGAVVIIRKGAKWAIPVILAQAFFLSLAGARSMVLASCVLSVYGALIAGVKIPRQRLVAGALIMVMLGVFISSARAEVGRAVFGDNQTFSARVGAIGSGALALTSSANREAVLEDMVYRFDGNTFGALILENANEADPVGLRTVRNTIALAIPSFIYRGKLNLSLEERNEETYIIYRYGLPPKVDFLPTFWGSVLAYFGPVALLVLALFIGIAVARLDAWVLRSASPVLFLFGIGLGLAVIQYEQGVPALILTMRGVLLFMAMLWAVRIVNRTAARATGRDRTEEPAPPQPMAVRR